MEEKIIAILKFIAKPLLGRGIIDKHFPYLIRVFQLTYGRLVGGGIKTVPIPNGLKLKVYAGDIGMGLPLTLKGSYEKKTTEVFLSLLKKNQVVFDIGANAGYYTILASKGVGSNGQVYSFEPDPGSSELVERNVLLNNCKNVKLIKKALSEKSGTSYFKSEKFNKGDSSLASEGGIKVQTTTLDDFITESKIEKADLIIMDIEGAEILALRGGKEFLSGLINSSLIIEYNPSSLEKLGFGSDELTQQIQNLGYKIIGIINEQEETLIPFSEKNLKQTMSHTTYCNLFAKK